MFFGGDPFEHFAHGHGGGRARRGPDPNVDTTKLYETLGVSLKTVAGGLHCCCCCCCEMRQSWCQMIALIVLLARCDDLLAKSQLQKPPFLTSAAVSHCCFVSQVEKSATGQEIKKAYRKLAVKVRMVESNILLVRNQPNHLFVVSSRSNINQS